MNRLSLNWILTGCLFVLGGCNADPTKGWSNTSIFTSQVKTVAVPIAQNTTQYRQMGFLLTDAVIKEIESRTPWKVTYTSRADTVLNMTINDVQLQTISLSDLTGLNEEVVVSLNIDFNWDDLETNQTIFARQRFLGRRPVCGLESSGETIQVGEFQVIQQMATDIVDEMAASW